MRMKICCVNPSTEEDTNNKNIICRFRILHEYITKFTIFRWKRCEKCGGIYLDKINNIIK